MPRDMGTPKTKLVLVLQGINIFGVWLVICHEELAHLWGGTWSTRTYYAVIPFALCCLLFGIQWYRYRTQKSAQEIFGWMYQNLGLLFCATIMFGFFAGIFWFAPMRPLIVIPFLGWLYVAIRVWWGERQLKRQRTPIS